MKYCSNCGNEVDNNAVVCPRCGCSLKNESSYEEDSVSSGLNILALFFPIIGLVLYCVNIDKYPIKAKGIGKYALIGFAIGMVSWLMLLAM